MADEVSALVDRFAINDLLADYTQGCDTGDFDLVSSCFTADASIDYDSLPPFPGGFSDFLEVIKQNLSLLVSTQHFVGNIRATIVGNTATCVSYVQTTHVAANGDSFTSGGRYDDDLIRTEAGWRICHRKFRRQFVHDTDGLISRMAMTK